jgi:hypothetical protein
MHTHALMWAIGRTDGEIPFSMLTMLLPGSDADRDRAVRELLAAGHWTDTPTGWRLPGWTDTQSTVAQVENNRRRERNKKRRQRANVPPGKPPGESTEGVRNGTERQELTEQKERSGSSNAGTAARSNGVRPVGEVVR